MSHAFRYQLPTERNQPARRRLLQTGRWFLVILWVAGLLAWAVLRHRQRRHEAGKDSEKRQDVMHEPADHIPSPFNRLTFPTQADLLSTTNQGVSVFMPTASGNPHSALFGSTRTGSDGLARFHAGIDIAPMRRDRTGKPLDEVVAITDGRVGYVNRVGGNSSYGSYVVLLHDDPIGPVYSLYAHLASVSTEIRAGTKVAGGATLGVMGNSASTGIPAVRAHLHLEIGLLLSERFGAWSRARKVTPDRGNYHGWNLFSIDPLDVYVQQHMMQNFTIKEYLKTVPVAFELVLSAPRRPDYFKRYPTLWQGSPDLGSGILVLGISEGGVILSGRHASDLEVEIFKRHHKTFVQSVNEEVLGRNGLHLISKTRGLWTLGRAANRWIDVLTF